MYFMQIELQVKYILPNPAVILIFLTLLVCHLNRVHTPQGVVA